MALVDSLLTAIARADGDVLVMHVGEKPYVVAPAGRVELSTKALTVGQMTGMLTELLPEAQQRTLAELGAVEHDLVAGVGSPDRFRLVAARGGDDIWIEVRRHRAVGSTTPADAPMAASGPPAEAQSAVVLPLQRSAIRPERFRDDGERLPPSADVDRLLRLAAARGASTVYLVADSPPLAKIDGAIEVLGGERSLEATEVETMLLDLAPEPNREALRSGEVTEWLADVQALGRVRCMSFRDHRGPGGILRLIPSKPVTADQLGLAQPIQSLGVHPDGLVVVSGPRASGKSTLLSSLIDLINRTRSDHVITLEHQIKFVHQSQRCFVSQREVRHDGRGMARAVKAALREDPDVLVLGDLRTAEVVDLALEAADSGRLVLGGVTARSATGAIERLVDRFPSDERARVRQALAATLRGVVVQVLLQKTHGGRLAARELLLNTAPVASLIAEAKTFQLPLAIESGRKVGMVPLNDALAAFVQSGAVEPREAYRRASDREGLVNLLKRAGVDTSFVERLA